VEILEGRRMRSRGVGVIGGGGGKEYRGNESPRRELTEVLREVARSARRKMRKNLLSKTRPSRNR